MANHKSSLKRIRQTEEHRVRNRYQHVTMRNALKKIRSTKDKADADAQMPVLFSMLDKLAKNSIIHKNKAANLKSKVHKYVASL